MLGIEKTIEDKKVRVALKGRLDTITAPALENELRELLPGTEELDLYCEGLEYISSAGLRVLLAAQKIMGNQGMMKLVHVNEIVMGVFELTGFSDILTIE